jgi:hypothetical protein
MPEITEVYQNTANYSDSSWKTDDIFIADCTYVSFIVHCSVSCAMYLKWKIDNTTNTYIEETKSVVANTATTLYAPVKSRYVEFSVDTFNSVPCNLKTQGFYF